MVDHSARITPAHLVGLVVGEGCFYAESAADPKYRSGWRIRPAFCVEMRFDDVEVLESLRSHLGCGGIYKLEFGRYRGYEAKGWHPHAKFRVGNIRELHDSVVPFLDSNPLFGRKAIAFTLFKDLVELVYRRVHLTEAGLDRARRLADELAAHNRRGRALA